MLKIPDDFLIDSYKKAIALNLCPQFISLLEKEIKRRRSLQFAHRDSDFCYIKKESPSIH
ncbi:sporulation histidine kinase inhibitor Sda [Sporosarcina sp. ACRSL]|uniref:sporulation histidine kinase inhibitor Sda n=1 Tax=Sporosarcina sp. ACRSL TaxID=2918215 RepID=UPI001EF4143B|nr:sporulation histidine kinase inhibitor Sda [Sporosarcina sp. ACRSL]MCG7344256.1 sporulation histidine kinase inhibitor Sda [Sporosarcina sp. ACRSL]